MRRFVNARANGDVSLLGRLSADARSIHASVADLRARIDEDGGLARGVPVFRGVLLGSGALLKPQVALPFRSCRGAVHQAVAHAIGRLPRVNAARGWVLYCVRAQRDPVRRREGLPCGRSEVSIPDQEVFQDCLELRPLIALAVGDSMDGRGLVWRPTCGRCPAAGCLRAGLSGESSQPADES